MSFDTNNSRPTERASMPELLTYEFRGEMQRKLESEFPLLTPSNLPSFTRGEIEFGSIDMTDPNRLRYLSAFLKRCQNPHDVLISRHGLRHEDVGDVARVLHGGLGLNETTIRKVSYTNAENKHAESRFEFTRLTHFQRQFPEALVESGWLMQKNVEERITGLRQIAKDSGYDIAMLTAAYLNLDERTLFGQVFNADVFRDPDKAGLQVPSANRTADAMVYGDLKKIITQTKNPHNQMPNTYSRAYQQAAQRLVAWSKGPENLLYLPVRINGLAKALVPTLMERAYAVANERFREPKLTATIQDLYQDRIVTSWITGYVQWDFKTLTLMARSQRVRDPENEIKIVGYDHEEAF